MKGSWIWSNNFNDMFGDSSNKPSKWDISCYLEVAELDLIEIYEFKIKNLKVHFENNEYGQQIKNSLLSLMLNDMTKTVLKYQKNLINTEDKSPKINNGIGNNVSSDELNNPLYKDVEQIDLEISNEQIKDISKQSFNSNEEIKQN